MTLADHTEEAARLGEAGAELDAVEAALRRLDDGSFDRCEVCGAPIPSEQLSADPLRLRCAQHRPPEPPGPPAPPSPPVLSPPV